ncbi:MAG: potassium-transporting ATPase subunit KdpC [Ruminococcus sp.]|jgi:K+-transporting ATPase ATPase C chain|nr:potassium-transporting ATPase subunit KdpC [Ruminococcus sp.]
MKTIKSILPKALIFFLIATIVCGIIYPLLITGISQIFFKDKANGSIIEVDGKKYGSELLAQQFTDDKYMWGRIMNIDTGTFKDENGNTLMYACPSNLSPASDEYEKLVAERVEKIKAANPEKGDTPIPVDLVTCSGSGLDPDISPAAAEYQIERIAKARGISTTQVEEIVLKYTENRFLGIFGEKIVNVLKVNLALDGILK